MHIIQVGRRRLNLEYLVMDEEFDGTEETRHIPAGGIRVTMECGEQFNLKSDEADIYRRQVIQVLAHDPGPVAPSVSSTTNVDPKTGAALPAKRRVQKERG